MNNQRRRNPNEIGVAWLKTTKNGDAYISISLSPESRNFDLSNCYIDMYVNENKANPKAPDYRITAKPKGETAQRGAPPQQRPKPAFPQPRNQFTQSAPASEPPPNDDSDPEWNW